MTEPDPIAPAVKALDALLVAIDGNPTGPALTAYRAAIRRHGVNIADTAGANGLRTALDRVAALSPQHAEDRRVIVSAALPRATVPQRSGPLEDLQRADCTNDRRDEAASESPDHHVAEQLHSHDRHLSEVWGCRAAPQLLSHHSRGSISAWSMMMCMVRCGRTTEMVP